MPTGRDGSAMSDRSGRPRGHLHALETSRRDVLKAMAGGGLAIGGAKAVDNAVLGYGVLAGTNLLDQDLAGLVAESLEPAPFEVTLGGVRLEFTGDSVRVADADRTEMLGLVETTHGEAAAVDAEFDLKRGPLEQLASDLPAIARGEGSFEFEGYRSFFDRLESVETRPFAVESLRDRRWMDVSPETVESFANASPTEPRAVVDGLAEGFREHTYYDAPRYVAGSIEDNVLLGAADLRASFRSPTSFEAIERDEDTGLFCWDFTHRSMEALQAVPAHRQAPPVFGRKVYDRRHGHVYTSIGSVYREDGELTLLSTFVDYSRSTWYDDFRVRWLFGEGLNAYDRRHRATGIH